MLNPIEDRDKVVASILSRKGVATGIDFADGELLVERTEVENCVQVSI